MKIFQLHAGGYYTSGMAVVAANTLEHALDMVNEESDPQWKLTYNGRHSIIGEETTVNARVMALHEYGLPNMPSKGSGVKVTF